MIVELKQKSRKYPDLSPRHPYVVIGIEADHYRILNDAGRPYLYPPRLFTCLDRRKPDDWVEERGDDGERYAYPPALGKPGFFEEFFDDKPDAVRTFWRVVNRRLAFGCLVPDRAMPAFRGVAKGATTRALRDKNDRL